MSVAHRIREITSQSDIEFDSKLYEQIARKLTDLGLNLAFFVFEDANHSAYARTLDGASVACPVLSVYLKYNDDFDQTGIDPRQGNWDDKWAQTPVIRDVLNSVLRSHGLDSDFVSDHTFLFVRTLEELAFQELGRHCRAGVRRFISRELPGAVVSHLFWNGRQFDVIFESKDDYKRAKKKLQAKAPAAISKLLAAADKEGHCQSYQVSVEFGYSGMNLIHLIREDFA